MTTSPSLSIDELIAVNDELGALVRAGVPLESTLGEMAKDMPGRTGHAMQELAHRIERGEDLSQALAAMPKAFPPMYRTAVEAGIRAGRLPAVLEDLAHSARKLSELRRFVALAALYPFIVLFVACSLFVFFVGRIAPVLQIAFEGHSPLVLQWMVAVGQTADKWGPVLLIVLLVVPAVWRYRMIKGNASLRWVPVVGKMLRDARVASFSEILGLLIEHDVPLVEAAPLAADASADKQLSIAARKLSEQLVGGTLSPDFAAANQDLPPFFVWLASAGQSKELLVNLLRQSAEMYRRRALRRSDWIRAYIPIIVTILIAGAVVLLYALSLFVPLTELLHEAANDNLMVW